MSDMIGYNFDPQNQRRALKNINAAKDGGQLGPLANDAIRILSLRLPTILGGHPVAVSDLLNPTVGGAGGQGSAVTDSLTNAGVAPPLSTAPPMQGSPAMNPLASPTFGPSGADEAQRLGQLAGSAINPPPPHIEPGDIPPRVPLPPSEPPITMPGPVSGAPIDNSSAPPMQHTQPVGRAPLDNFLASLFPIFDRPWGGGMHG